MFAVRKKVDADMASTGNVKGTVKTSKAWLLPVVFLIVGVVVLGVLGYSAKNSQDELSRSKVELNAMTYAQHMQLDIMQGVSITDMLEQVIVSGDGEIRNFSEIAESQMKDYIQSIQLAPGGVVTDIYPEAGNEAGKIDLIHDKDRGEISCYARDNNVITMQGPFNLKQGGAGIAIRNPVYVEGAAGQKEFWGFTIVIIRVPEIFSESINALSEFGYDYKLSKSVAPWDDSPQEVYGSGADMQDAATYNFDLGDSHWLLEVRPKNGWDSNQGLYMTIGCGILIVFLISGLLAVLGLFRKTRAAEKQTASLNQELQEALKRAHAASLAKTQFISNMSHDMRTPMNAIMGYTTIALNRHPKENVAECLRKINVSSDHLLMLINDVLEISRIESGKEEANPTRANLPAVVSEVADVARGFANGRALNIKVELALPKGLYVLMDEVRIREVLVNMLSNAVKFTGDGGTITFSTSYKQQRGSSDIAVTFVIADTGVGMSEEFQRHMFEPFAQEKLDARTRYEGTGLGLPISKHYIEMMGGTIAVESQKGVGTTFTITIPMQLAPVQDAIDGGCAAVRADLSGVHVLLAEDNALNAEIAQTLLEEKGACVTVAADGRQAIELFRDSAPEAFDVILMDVMMPEMDGLAATRAIRALDRPDATTVPIIAMTANAFAEDAQKCLDAGMNAHLAKPVDMKKVEQVMCQQIEASAKHRASRAQQA